jgi:hypothetical protein
VNQARTDLRSFLIRHIARNASFYPSLLQNPRHVILHRTPLLDRLRQAFGHQRTALAPLLVDRRGRPAGGYQGVRQAGRILGFPPQGLVENDVETVPGLAVEERPLRDRDEEHLLQTDRLRAELDPVTVVRLGLAPLVLHGEGQPGTVRLPMELHNVGLPDQPQTERSERHPIVDPDITPRFPAFVVHPLMHDPAFGGETVLRPDLLNVNKGATPRTI